MTGAEFTEVLSVIRGLTVVVVTLQIFVGLAKLAFVR